MENECVKAGQVILAALEQAIFNRGDTDMQLIGEEQKINLAVNWLLTVGEIFDNGVKIDAVGVVGLESFRSFVVEHVDCLINSGGNHIWMVDFEHEGYNGGDIPIELKAMLYVSEAVALEHIPQEIEANAQKAGWVVSTVFQLSRRNPYIAERLDPFLKMIKYIRGDILSLDIANKLTYPFLKQGSLALSLAVMAIPNLRKNSIIRSLAMHTGLNRILFERLQATNQRGLHFDKRRIHAFWESLNWDIEDARRVFVARNLENLSTKYNNILVVYPKAHAMRIVEYLTSNNRLMQLSYAVKGVIYPFIYPGLDYKGRIFRAVR